MNLDVGLLIKIMGRTQSSSDGEVLIAIRKANEMLAKARVGWTEVISLGNGTGAAVRDEILRQATAQARERNFGEELRARQAQRDRAADERRFAPDFATDGLSGWTTRDAYTAERAPKPDWKIPDDEADEIAAREMAHQIEGELEQTNLFVFAMNEPEIARWLFEQRNSGIFTRVLFRQVCERGELAAGQRVVCHHMRERGR
jgi:hypothetical protein